MVARRLTWRRQHGDIRDLKFTAVSASLPDHVDHTSICAPVQDQGNAGSCVEHAIMGDINYQEKKEGRPLTLWSRLFSYYNARAIEGNTHQDAGSTIRDGIKSVSKMGLCLEKLWPYDLHLLYHKPTVQCFSAAAKSKITQYLAVAQQENLMKACLAQGFCIVVGISVYDSFMSDEVAASGVVPMPDVNSESLQGGHALLCVGYTPTEWIIRNSWGHDWGQKGYCRIPKAYLLNPDLADDFWTIRYAL